MACDPESFSVAVSESTGEIWQKAAKPAVAPVAWSWESSGWGLHEARRKTEAGGQEPRHCCVWGRWRARSSAGVLEASPD